MENNKICKGCGKSKPNNSIYFEERVSTTGKIYLLGKCRVCYNSIRKQHRKKSYIKRDKIIEEQNLKIFLEEKEKIKEELIAKKTKLFEEYNAVYLELKKLNSLIRSEIAKVNPTKRKSKLVRKPKLLEEAISAQEINVSSPPKVTITPEERIKYSNYIKQLNKIKK